MSVVFIKDGHETAAEVLQERDGNFRDLSVNGERYMSVPYWKRTETRNVQGETQEVEVQRSEPCWRPA